MATTKVFTAIIHKEEDIYVAQCPEAVTVSQGESVEDEIANIKEATELYLEEFPLPENSLPTTITFKTNYAQTIPNLRARGDSCFRASWFWKAQTRRQPCCVEKANFRWCCRMYCSLKPIANNCYSLRHSPPSPSYTRRVYRKFVGDHVGLNNSAIAPYCT